ncbi:D-amino-acid transaminase [Paenibacillus jiagnxiensis]|uniref:D-amino-acid transaminase n=1 Tax=Paenibacillus jiagnxiensis TaxID=3228926 RepID=UPI0033AAD416
MFLWNGRLVQEDEIQVSYLDRGYYFGDGIYEVFRIYDGKLFEKQAHLNRLFQSLREVRITLSWSEAELSGMVDSLAETFGKKDGILYLQITRGSAKRSHLLPESAEPVMLGYCEEVARPVEQLKKGIATITLDDERWHKCHIKSLNLLANTLARQEAADAGAEEAVLVRDGRVTECTASNVMIVKKGVIITHPNGPLILDGITKQVVERLAKQSGIPYRTTGFTLEELMDADEVFVTSTTKEVMPVTIINGIKVGSGIPGVITQLLQHGFEQKIKPAAAAELLG